jgi:hypothetical protein
MNQGGTPIIKWIIFAILSLGIMTSVTYIVVSLVSNSVPTKSGSVKPKEQPPYGFKIHSPLESGKNTYTLTGVFFDVNTDNSTIAIKAEGGNTYIFKISKYLLKDTDWWIRAYTVPDLNTLAKGIPVDPTSVIKPGTENILTSAIQISLTADPNPNDLKTIIVRWNDIRNLDQITADYKNNPNIPINVYAPDNLVLGVVK